MIKLDDEDHTTNTDLCPVLRVYIDQPMSLEDRIRASYVWPLAWRFFPFRLRFLLAVEKLESILE